MKTLHLDSLEEIGDLYTGILEDFRDINYLPWLSDELNRLADLHKGFFDSSSGPDGAPWKANAPRTIAEKGHSTVLRGIRTSERSLRKMTRPLKTRRTRWIGGYRLATSLTARGTGSAGDAVREAIQTSDKAYLGFGTTVEYSLPNDQGTDHIPARPHIGMNEKHLDGMVERVADYALDQLKKM